MRKASRETNCKQHREIDQVIIKQSGTSDTLTETRARQQARYVQTHHEDCPPGFIMQPWTSTKVVVHKMGRPVPCRTVIVFSYILLTIICNVRE